MQFVDYSFEVPVLGGTQRVLVNAIDVVHSLHCHVCSRTLTGAVVALGSPYSTLLHRECLNNFDYTQPWQHRFPAAVYREQAMASHFQPPARVSPPPAPLAQQRLAER